MLDVHAGKDKTCVSLKAKNMLLTFAPTMFFLYHYFKKVVPKNKHL